MSAFVGSLKTHTADGRPALLQGRSPRSWGATECGAPGGGSLSQPPPTSSPPPIPHEGASLQQSHQPQGRSRTSFHAGVGGAPLSLTGIEGSGKAGRRSGRRDLSGTEQRGNRSDLGNNALLAARSCTCRNVTEQAPLSERAGDRPKERVRDGRKQSKKQKQKKKSLQPLIRERCRGNTNKGAAYVHSGRRDGLHFNEALGTS